MTNFEMRRISYLKLNKTKGLYQGVGYLRLLKLLPIETCKPDEFRFS